MLLYLYMEKLPYPLCSPKNGTIKPLPGSYFYDDLIEAIENSKNSIKIVQYQWKWNVHERHGKVQRLGASILRANKRGVAISVILNTESPNSHLTKINRVTHDALCREGIQVRNRNPSGLLHTKLWIIDSNIVYVGSHNISVRSLSINEEMTVKIESPEIAEYMNIYFNLLWSEK